MGSSPYGPGTNFVRWLFIICNCIFLLLGAVTLSIGIWGLVVGSQGDYDVITGNNTVSAAAVLLTAGIITFITAGIGIVGGWGMWRPLLIIYTIVVGVVIMLEIVAGILAFVYRHDISDEIGSNMKNAIKDYRVNRQDPTYKSDTNNAVENVQDVFKCCGADSSRDWLALNLPAVVQNNGMPPGKCQCDLTDKDCEMVNIEGLSYNAWKNGCTKLLKKNLQLVSLVIGIVGIFFAMIEAILMGKAIGLLCCIRSSQPK